MDCLIDFNSPKLKREDVPLIPGSFQGMLNPFFATGEESNPFDMVVCQVAANAAAENDPFEMVLHNAMNCHETRKIDSNTRGTISPLFSSKQDKEGARRSISLPDLRHIAVEEDPTTLETGNVGRICVNSTQVLQKISKSPHAVSKVDCLQNATTENNDSAEWNYLDDIPPPDSLLNSTVDMSCFLDDTLSASNPCEPIKKTQVPLVSLGIQQISTESPGSQKLSKSCVKSEEEIISLAQKKIENIINKATLAVRNDIEDSIIRRRSSVQLLAPYQEALVLCTPKRSQETRSCPRIEPALSVEEWSRNEMMKLNIALPERAIKPSISRGLECNIDSISNSYLCNEANISSEEMPVEDLSFSSPLKQVTPPKQKERKLTPDSVPLKKTPDLSSSPALLPLPLCEDAVRNLCLFSKYSPKRNSTHQDKSCITQSINTSSQPEQNGKQSKLFLRKPAVSSRTSSKMAPMKATAPVQNMTRTKSSLPPSTKIDIKNSVTSAVRKSVSKVPQSPRRTLSGSLPNLSSQGSSTPSKLPSPRRSVATMHEPIHVMKRPTENGKASSSTLNSSPRPTRKGPLYNKSGRVLADINTSSSSRNTPKCKNNQSDTPRRGRIVVTEKENFL